MKFLVAIRFLGHERKFCYIEAKRKGDFYAHLRHDNPPRGLPPLVRHMAYHERGERHLKIEGKGIETRYISRIKLQSISNFRGVEALLRTFVLRGQFADLRLLGQPRRNVILLDCDSAGFRDAIFFIRVHLVEPNKEQEIPTPADVGPRLLRFERSTKPWIALEIFQEKLPDSHG